MYMKAIVKTKKYKSGKCLACFPYSSENAIRICCKVKEKSEKGNNHAKL